MFPMFPPRPFHTPVHPSAAFSAYNNMFNQMSQQAFIMMAQQQQLKAQMMSMMKLNQHKNYNVKKEHNLEDSDHAETPVKPIIQLEDNISSQSTCSQSTFEPLSNIKAEFNIKQEAINALKLPKKVHVKKEFVQEKAPKNEVDEMVRFLLDNVGKISESKLDKAREGFARNPKLVPVFDCIVEKYISVKKHREDIVRYIVRRCFKYLKTNTIKGRKSIGKRAYAILCKRYFKENIEELEKSGITIEDEKELIEFILPYRKNSKNRTMNINFTAEIFSSVEFIKDYKVFLDQFDAILEKDNAAKITRLVQMAEEAVKKGSVDKIKSCTRLPWTRLWIEKTKEMSMNLANYGLTQEDEEVKKMKVVSTPESMHSIELNIKTEAKSESD